jgi:hypothetical protein
MSNESKVEDETTISNKSDVEDEKTKANPHQDMEVALLKPGHG